MIAKSLNVWCLIFDSHRGHGLPNVNGDQLVCGIRAVKTRTDKGPSGLSVTNNDEEILFFSIVEIGFGAPVVSAVKLPGEWRCCIRGRWNANGKLSELNCHVRETIREGVLQCYQLFNIAITLATGSSPADDLRNSRYWPRVINGVF